MMLLLEKKLRVSYMHVLVETFYYRGPIFFRESTDLGVFA